MNSITSALSALAANLSVLKTYTASTLAFAGSNLTDSANGLAIFPAYTRVKVSGSAHNDGTYDILSSAAGTLTLAQTLITESAGAGITLEWKPETIYADPRDAVTLTDFPSIVLALTPGVPHVWSVDAAGLGRNDYTVSIYVFLGARGQAAPPLAELHARVLPWAKAVSDLLMADLTLRATSGMVKFIGSGTQGKNAGLFKYQHGPMEWGDGTYWVLEIIVPVAEKHIQTMA